MAAHSVVSRENGFLQLFPSYHTVRATAFQIVAQSQFHIRYFSKYLTLICNRSLHTCSDGSDCHLLFSCKDSFCILNFFYTQFTMLNDRRELPQSGGAGKYSLNVVHYALGRKPVDAYTIVKCFQ